MKAVCLCDWAMSTVPYDQWWRTAVRKCRNWVPSARPCGAREKTRNGVGCVSAGTRDNRKIPVFALDNMIDFIKEAFLESD
ncbi:unnamed protein product [Anisakis simplex]|uniref:Uncharacterized protein n=1 Tax=Anisakis simplex TaxID=6269 RepID=A0A3P6S3U6_ANISI|nr:unnamed protein product [Anisakis simplex]